MGTRRACENPCGLTLTTRSRLAPLCLAPEHRGGKRVRVGLSVIKAKLERDGKFVSKASKVRKRLGRPGAEADKLDRARQELAKGMGICKTARLTGLGTGTVHKLRREMGTV